MTTPKIVFVNAAIAFVLLMLVFGCKKDRCKPIEIAQGICAFDDTTQSYQLLPGKWYLKTYEISGPHSETQFSCYSDQQNYLEFLPNRTVYVHGAALRTRDTIIQFELFPDSTWVVFVRNKTPLFDNTLVNEIVACENLVHVSFTNGMARYHYTFSR